MEHERRRSAVERGRPPDAWGIQRATPCGLLALALGYFALSITGWQLATPAVNGAPWWPAAGLTLGVMCRVRRTDWAAVAAAVFVADFAADLMQSVPLATSVAWATANTLEPLLGALALRRIFGGRLPPFATPRHVAVFFVTIALAGAPLASLIGAVAGALTLDQELLVAWQVWYLGDVLGILVVAPVVLFSRQLRASFDAPLGLILGLAAGASAVVFSGIGDPNLVRPYLVGPVLVLAAFTHGTPGAVAAGLVTAVVANVFSALGYGPFAVTDGNPNALIEFQLFMTVQLLTVQMLASVLTQMRYARTQAGHLTAERLRDPLTGTGNRLRLDHALEEVTAPPHDGAPGPPAAALFLDLDDFKPINDRYGHAAGDDTLRIVAERIQQVVRDTDIVARVGGDEFAVVCPAISEPAVCELATRLRTRLGQPMSVQGHTLQVGVSIGHSWIAGPTGNATDLLRRADQDMYRIKSARGEPGGAGQDGQANPTP